MERKVLDRDDILRILPNRPAHAHKGNFGKILMLCGSRGQELRLLQLWEHYAPVQVWSI